MSYFRQYCKYLEPLENILVLYNILYKIYIYIYIYILYREYLMTLLITMTYTQR